MQADQFHYLHHRKFECNYGTSGEPLDRWFGTYRGSLDPKDKDYQGGASDKELDKEFSENGGVGESNPAAGSEGAKKKTAAASPDSEVFLAKKPGVCGGQSVFGGAGGLSPMKALPTLQDGLYHLHYCIVFAIFGRAVCGDPFNLGILGWELPLGPLGKLSNAQLMSGMVAYGPILFGALMLMVFKDRYSWSWPFHKDKVLGSFGFHVAVGYAMTALPTYWLGMACFGQAPPML